MPLDPPTRSRRTMILVFLCGFALAGCGQEESIQQYTVAKEPVPPLPPTTLPPAAEGVKSRTLGAIVPNDDRAWFFKLTGPAAPVEGQMENFLVVVNSLKFVGPDKTRPEWTLPKGWTQEPGTGGMRYATLKTDDEEPLELTIIPLDGDGTETEYILSNVNRWRDQLGLPPKSATTLFQDNTRTDETRRVDLAGRSVVLVNIVGTSKPSGMGSPPFAGGPFSGGGRPRSNGPPPEFLRRPPARLTFATPKGWTKGEATGMRKAAFTVESDGRALEITAIDLPAEGQGGDWLANVNRWRGQLGLESQSQEQLQKETEKVTVGGLPSQQVVLQGMVKGKNQSILGVMTVRDDKAWFFKMQGDTELAAQERPRFQEFLSSLDFEGQ